MSDDCLILPYLEKQKVNLTNELEPGNMHLSKIIQKHKKFWKTAVL